MIDLPKCLLAAFAAASLAGCAGQRALDYHPANEIPEGPGLVSGEDGVFVLYSDKAKDQATSETPAADQESFKAFQDWKRQAEGTAEYRQFQEWLEWKEWRRQQAN